jgi:GPH family glycoside/pentoside/hexuronide:cation symporter
MSEQVVNNTNNKSSIRKFGLKDKLGYLFCEIGDDMLYFISTAFLMVFYTDVLFISPAVVGIILMVGKIWDAFADVTIGRYIDSRKNGPNGRFKPMIIRFGPILGIATILLFTKIPGISNNVAIFYALVTYIIWGTIYSCVTIPFGALASVITSDSSERASLSTFRGMGSSIGATSTIALVPMFIFINNKASSERFFIVSIVLAILATICYVISYKSMTERVFVAENSNKPKINLLASFKALGKNKPFMCVIGIAVVSLISQAISGAMSTYLYKDYFRNTVAMGIGGMLGLLNIVLVAPLVAKLTKKYGKKEAASIALLISSILYLVLFLVPIHNAFVFVTLNYIANLGYGFYSFTLWAFVGDAIDYQEYITEERQDGTIYALYSFVKKVAQAVSGGAGAFVLGAIGYAAKAPQQTAEVAGKVRNFAILTPSIGYILMFLILFFLYPMTQEALKEIQDELERRRTGNN